MEIFISSVFRGFGHRGPRTLNVWEISFVFLAICIYIYILDPLKTACFLQSAPAKALGPPVPENGACVVHVIPELDGLNRRGSYFGILSKGCTLKGGTI